MAASMEQDLYNRVSAAKTLAPEARTTSASGTAIDLQGYESAVALIEVGAWTDGTHTYALQESDTTTDGDFADVVDADLQGTEPAVASGSTENTVHKLGYLGDKRYLRVRVVITAGPSTGLASAATIVRSHGRHQPST